MLAIELLNNDVQLVLFCAAFIAGCAVFLLGVAGRVALEVIVGAALAAVAFPLVWNTLAVS
jgi:hypothetical protein